MDFKDYGFKPADVVKGLNEYYEKRKKGVYGTFIVRTGTDRLGETSYMNPAVYVKEAIDWLRDEHDIFYTPGLEVSEPDIFDNPRYKFLSILSSELGFRTIVGPGNADKTEQDILRVVKHLLAIKQKYDGTSCAYDKRIEKRCKEYNVAPCGEDDIALKIDYIFGVLDEWRKRALKAEEDRVKFKGMLNTWYGASSLKLGFGPSSLGMLKDGTLINREDFADLVGIDKHSTWSQIFEKVREVLNKNNCLQHFHDKVYAALDFGSLTSETIAVDEVKAYRLALRELYFTTVGSNPDNRANPSSMKSVILQQFKEKDAAFKAVCDEDDVFRKRTHEAEQKLDELRAKVREIYRAFHGCWEEGYSYTAALDVFNDEYQRLKHDTNYFREFEKNCSDRQAFIFKLFEALDIDKEHVITSFFDDEEAAILKAIEDNNKATASVYRWNQAYSKVRDILGVHPDSDAEAMVIAANSLVDRLATENAMRLEEKQRRKEWVSKYESEHERANGEHRRAEKFKNESAGWQSRVEYLVEQCVRSYETESVAVQAFRNECRKLRDEKAKVIKALGQDIWDDCVK